MKSASFLLCGLLFLLAGCKSVDGTYYPGCPAYAGDKVQLDGGRVTWDRFTDVVRIGVDGQPVDPFPDYPRHGTYRVRDGVLSIELAGEDAPRNMHVLADADRLMLLTRDQHADWQQTGRYEPCALTRERALAR